MAITKKNQKTNKNRIQSIKITKITNNNDIKKINTIKNILQKIKMTHYICTGGCRGVSPNAKSCGAESCPKHGKPLSKCGCEDNEHDGAFEN